MKEVAIRESAGTLAYLTGEGIEFKRLDTEPGVLLADVTEADQRALTASGIPYDVRASFIEAQSSGDGGPHPEDASVYGSNDEDVPILEVIGHSGSWIHMGGAPAGATVAYIDLTVVIRTSPHSELAVGYGEQECISSASVSGCAGVYLPRQPNGDISGTEYHITEYAGSPVNQYWLLVAKDYVADGDSGFIDFWSLRIYYHTDDPTPTPTPTPRGYHVVNVPAVADTFTSNGNQPANYGLSQELSAGYRRELRSWFKFDVSNSGIPADAEINQADMMLFYLGGTADVSLAAFPPQNDWGEMSISWSNQPGYDDTSVSSHWVSTGSPTYIAWNVTSIVGQWLRGERANCGVMLTDFNDSHSALLASREATNVSQRPYLRVAYTFDETPSPTASATSTATRTATPSGTATRTKTPTSTATATSTRSRTATPTRTATATATLSLHQRIYLPIIVNEP